MRSSLAHETAGAARTRHSLRPLLQKRDNEFGKLGQIMSRDRIDVSECFECLGCLKN
jgi:hypothetical protein